MCTCAHLYPYHLPPWKHNNFSLWIRSSYTCVGSFYAAAQLKTQFEKKVAMKIKQPLCSCESCKINFWFCIYCHSYAGSSILAVKYTLSILRPTGKITRSKICNVFARGGYVLGWVFALMFYRINRYCNICNWSCNSYTTHISCSVHTLRLEFHITNQFLVAVIETHNDQTQFHHSTTIVFLYIFYLLHCNFARCFHLILMLTVERTKLLHVCHYKSKFNLWWNSFDYFLQ